MAKRPSNRVAVIDGSGSQATVGFYLKDKDGSLREIPTPLEVAMGECTEERLRWLGYEIRKV